MILEITGEKKEVKDGISVKKLIEIENVETPEYVTVSVNDELLDHDAFESSILKDGDRVEFIYFMGGGTY